MFVLMFALFATMAVAVVAPNAFVMGVAFMLIASLAGMQCINMAIQSMIEEADHDRNV